MAGRTMTRTARRIEVVANKQAKGEILPRVWDRLASTRVIADHKASMTARPSAQGCRAAACPGSRMTPGLRTATTRAAARSQLMQVKTM